MANKVINIEDNDYDLMRATEREALTILYNSQTADKIMSEPTRFITDEEFAESMGMTLEEYHKWDEQSKKELFAELDELLGE